MIDPYYRVKSEIHKKRPTYGIIQTTIMILLAVNAGFFGYFMFNVESEKKCYV